MFSDILAAFSTGLTGLFGGLIGLGVVVLLAALAVCVLLGLPLLVIGGVFFALAYVLAVMNMLPLAAFSVLEVGAALAGGYLLLVMVSGKGNA